MESLIVMLNVVPFARQGPLLQGIFISIVNCLAFTWLTSRCRFSPQIVDEAKGKRKLAPFLRPCFESWLRHYLLGDSFWRAEDMMVSVSLLTHGSSWKKPQELDCNSFLPISSRMISQITKNVNIHSFIEKSFMVGGRGRVIRTFRPRASCLAPLPFMTDPCSLILVFQHEKSSDFPQQYDREITDLFSIKWGGFPP